MQEGVVLQYADGRIGAYNASAQRILGIPTEQFIGFSSLNKEQLVCENGSLFPEEHLPTQITLRTGQSCSNVVLGVQKDKNHFTWLSLNSQPLWHKGDKLPHAVVSTFTDITDRKQIEDALALSETRFRAIFDSAAVAITLIDPAGHYIQFNSRWLEMLGYTAEEMALQKKYQFLS
ncbi:sensory transduction histidine kinase [Beggiatoa sp. PS]|nr:sensory transduction histidine kinase [Beggiatoa sp. PS]